MKKLIALLLAAAALTALAACGLNNDNDSSTEAPVTEAAETSAATEAPTSAPETEPAPEIGELGDYVRTGLEVTNTFYGEDNALVYRLPEIMLDSSDAKSANSEINDRFGEYAVGGSDYNGATSIDYEAYLNQNILSVIVSSQVEGGNIYGLCYSFDVLTGEELSNEELCDILSLDYSEVTAELLDTLSDYYDEHYSVLPGNDNERAKTINEDNIKVAVLYLGENEKLTAFTDIYAAVGGGHWQISLEL